MTERTRSVDGIHLRSVVVEGFRGIDRLAIDLGELTTVIGEHDCGKSSLLAAIGRLLEADSSTEGPVFEPVDFHRPTDAESRATELTITLTIRSADDDEARLRVRAERADDDTVSTRVDAIDTRDRPVPGVDGELVLTELRRRHPAIIVGGPRAPTSKSRTVGSSVGRQTPGRQLRDVLRGATRAGSNLTLEQLGDVRAELLEAAGTLADQLAPVPERHRSVRDLADTPRPLTTNLADALEPDAGRHRRVAALWLLVAIVEAIPPDGLPPDSDPILLFDDIEANLHPTWLAAMASVALNLPFQEVFATHSSEVLAWMPLSSLRRLTRAGDRTEARRVVGSRYSEDELRRLTFHLRLNRGGSFFARCWVLVEGETEAWLVPEFARLAQVEFPVEGIRCIEYAQSGVEPLLKLAQDLGIPWLLLSDGDQAGNNYAAAARRHLKHGDHGRVMVLPARDIEHYLLKNGYRDVIARAAAGAETRSSTGLIKAATRQVSKPGLALRILEAADRRGPEAVPPVLREVADGALRLARD